MKFRFRYTIEADGTHVARCLDFFSCQAVAPTLGQLRVHAAEVLHKDLSVPPSTCIFRSPRAAADDAPLGNALPIFTVAIRPGAAFALSLRELRTNRILFQRQVARRLGMQLSAYQRLEDPKRANPTLETVARVKKIFPKFDVSILFEPDSSAHSTDGSTTAAAPTTYKCCEKVVSRPPRKSNHI